MQAALLNQSFKHLEKAMKAIFALNNKFKFSKMFLNVAMKLFYTCIMSILIMAQKYGQTCLIQIL